MHQAHTGILSVDHVIFNFDPEMVWNSPINRQNSGIFCRLLNYFYIERKEGLLTTDVKKWYEVTDPSLAKPVFRVVWWIGRSRQKYIPMKNFRMMKIPRKISTGTIFYPKFISLKEHTIRTVKSVWFLT
jgi:hypothetical protein